MSWKICPMHAVAAFEPTIGTGAMETGYAKGAIRTLDPTNMANIGSTTTRWWWDRGSTGGYAPVNCAFIVNHNLVSRSATFTIHANTTSNPTVVISGPNTPTSDANFMVTFSDNSQRYLAATITTSTGPTWCGLLSIGAHFDLGNPIYGWNMTHGFNRNGHAARIFSGVFPNVDAADGRAIAHYMGQDTVWRQGWVNPARDGHGGSRAVAVADPDGLVYYGEAQVQVTGDRPNKRTVSVTITDASSMNPLES